MLGYPQSDVEIGCRTLPNPWSTLTSVVSSAAEDEILFVSRGPVCLAVIWGLLSSMGIIEVKLRNEFLGTPGRGIISNLKVDVHRSTRVPTWVDREEFGNSVCIC